MILEKTMIYCDRAAKTAFVKVRPTLDEARTAIDYVKRRRISRATKTWLASNPWAAPLTWRGDAVYIASWRWPHHEIAAFELDLG